jgi:malate dehydrogenase (oxaloacetate-decarboxylating)(NADP+)
MKPVFERARKDPRRVIYAEGEDERVLRAVQVVCDEGLATPIVIGRPTVVEARIARLGLRIRPERDFALVNPESDQRHKEYAQTYHRLLMRKGVPPDVARTVLRTNTTAIAAVAVQRGDAEAMICGIQGRYSDHLKVIGDVIGKAEGVREFSALSLLILPSGTYFLCDTYVTPDPSAEEIVAMTLMAATAVRRFGIEPKVALLSHSSFGSADTPSAIKMREALRMLHETAPDLEVEGEMHADAALDVEIRARIFPSSRLAGPANLLIMPTLDAANIAFNLVKAVGEGLPVGPILMGAARPAHILTSSVTARGILNMTAVAVVEVQDRASAAAD